MANKTTNYELEKPLQTEFYDVEVQNRNMDKIDSQLKNSANDITSLNRILSEVKQSDAKKLPLTGGVLSGGLQLRDALILTHNDNDNSKDYSKLIKAHYDAEYGTDIWEVSSDGRISFLRISGKAYGHSEMARALLVRQNADGSNYSAKCIYHEGNITVSQSAPSSALAEGCQHQVY